MVLSYSQIFLDENQKNEVNLIEFKLNLIGKWENRKIHIFYVIFNHNFIPYNYKKSQMIHK